MAKIKGEGVLQRGEGPKEVVSTTAIGSVEVDRKRILGSPSSRAQIAATRAEEASQLGAEIKGEGVQRQEEGPREVVRIGWSGVWRLIRSEVCAHWCR